MILPQRQRLMALAAAFTVLLGGCLFGGGPGGALDDIRVVTYRYVIDEAEDAVRVLGIVRNTGEATTPAGEVLVTLRSRTGSLKGQNRTPLKPLEAGEERQFALTITAHGSIESVDIAIVEPEQAGDEEPGAESPGEDDMTEEGDG